MGQAGHSKDSHPGMGIEGGIGSGKNVRLSRVVYEREQKKIRL